MRINPPDPPHILFLFSDTGGGHRSAAEAIIEALNLEFGDQVSTEMVDIIKAYAPRPLNHMTAWYPHMVRIPQLWGLGFKLTDGRNQARLITGSTRPVIERSMRKLIDQNPCDLIVSVHPLANTPVLHAMGKNRPPFITVVTDLVSAHAFWYDQRVDMCIVPTEGAYQKALQCKMPRSKMKIIGLPVADRFCQPPRDRLELRRQLGWPEDLPMAVLVGGGEGMGPLEPTAHAIAEARLKMGLVIIAGRNQKLRQRLEAHPWPIPTYIYGFVRNMPDFMSAADILVTKAGPGTITEALNAGLPMILYSKLPGQEDGNVSYVTSEGAGIWTPEPERVVQALRNWVVHPETRNAAAQACQRLANPKAARLIARTLVERVGLRV